jgi:hypothetical protein
MISLNLVKLYYDKVNRNKKIAGNAIVSGGS